MYLAPLHHKNAEGALPARALETLASLRALFSLLFLLLKTGWIQIVGDFVRANYLLFITDMISGGPMVQSSPYNQKNPKANC